MNASLKARALRAAALLLGGVALPLPAIAQSVSDADASAAARMQTGPAPVAPGAAPPRVG